MWEPTLGRAVGAAGQDVVNVRGGGSGDRKVNHEQWS